MVGKDGEVYTDQIMSPLLQTQYQTYELTIGSGIVPFSRTKSLAEELYREPSLVLIIILL